MKFNFLAAQLESGFHKPAGFWLKSWRPFALLLLFGLILYSQTLFFDFAYLDDNSLILDNAPILSQASLGDIFSNDVFFSAQKFYYRPVFTLSLWFDFKLMQALPFWYHLSNIIYQVIASGLLFVFFVSLKWRRSLAWWGSFIFLIHPALVAAVAWVPGRNDILLTIFVLASWLFFGRWLRRASWGAWFGTSIFFLLALFTKETAIFLPLLMLIYLFLIRGLKLKKILSLDADEEAVGLYSNASSLAGRDSYNLSQGPGGLEASRATNGDEAETPILNQSQKIIILVSTWLVALLIWFLPRSIVLENTKYKISDLLSSLGQALPALFLYLGKAILPLNLSVFPTLADSNWAPGLAILFLLIIAFIMWSPRPRRAYLIFGGAWFLLFLLPSFLNPDTYTPTVFYEHRLHLPLVGLLIILSELDFIKNLDFKKTRTRIGLTLIVLLLLILNYSESRIYHDRFSFWSGAVSAAPHSAFARSNLGAMAYLSGNLAAAKTEYQEALFLNSSEPMTHNNLGVVYLEEKNYAAAEKEFNLELAANPNYDKALFNLGRLYYLEKRYSEAAYYWQATLVINPTYYEAYQYLLLLRNKIE